MRALRRWLLRLVALAALVGVGYGVYTIVREGTEDAAASRGPVQGALERLANAQEKLGARAEVLRPGDPPGRVADALRDTQRAHETAVRVFRQRRDRAEEVPDEAELDTALGAEFDYLDALRSVMTNRNSPLLRQLGSRAEAAKEAFTDLPDSAGVEDGVRGTQALILWARARR